MPPAARPAPDAFRRGLSAVVANPRLILAPTAFAAATLASVFVPVFLLVLRFAGSFSGFASGTSLSRDPARLVEPLRDLLGGLLASPFVLLLGLLALLAVLLLLTALAAFVRAGVTGCLLAIDGDTPEGASLAAFHRPGLGAVFFSSARKNSGRFFALVNLYGLALSFVVLLVVLPIGLVVFAGVSERGGLVALAVVLFLLFLPIAVGASIALRVLYLVACRLSASEDVDALEAVARAVSFTRASLSRAALLYLLTLAAGFVTGFAFVIPRFALSIVAGRSLLVFAFGTGILLFAQILVGLAYDLAVSGAFVSLWPADSVAGSAPPGGLASTEGPPPFLM